MEYRSNPDLPFIKSDWPGNPYKDGAFQYLSDPFYPDWKMVLRMMISPNPKAKAKRADHWTPPVHSTSHWFEDRENDFIVWLGHACFVIQLGGRRYITDPVLQGMPLVPRLVSPPFRTSAIPHLDYILISHDHRDHCDQTTLKDLLTNNSILKILAPLGMEQTIQDWIGDTTLETAGWFQQYQQASTEPQLTFMPTRHWSRRWLHDFNRVLWGAFVLQYADKTIYFGGDSALHRGHYQTTAELFPQIDYALLPIGAYDPSYLMQGAHMNPEEATEAFGILGAKHFVPMHYGTYDLSNEPISEPLQRVQAAMKKADQYEQLLVPKVNEVVYL
ncbi:MAG: MBL fold metallo-hydrolase [Bacteroidetes bacterium]|nr:MAG: MBL fold metallo-hydrolase [Bacteroidota bacterium]